MKRICLTLVAILFATPTFAVTISLTGNLTSAAWYGDVPTIGVKEEVQSKYLHYELRLDAFEDKWRFSTALADPSATETVADEEYDSFVPKFVVAEGAYKFGDWGNQLELKVGQSYLPFGLYNDKRNLGQVTPNTWTSSVYAPTTGTIAGYRGAALKYLLELDPFTIEADAYWGLTELTSILNEDGTYNFEGFISGGGPQTYDLDIAGGQAQVTYDGAFTLTLGVGGYHAKQESEDSMFGGESEGFLWRQTIVFARLAAWRVELVGEWMRVNHDDGGESYYGVLTFEILENLHVFGMYDRYYTDQDDPEYAFIEDYAAGMRWDATTNFVVKAERHDFKSDVLADPASVMTGAPAKHNIAWMLSVNMFFNTMW